LSKLRETLWLNISFEAMPAGLTTTNIIVSARCPRFAGFLLEIWEL
jgi:hypothetical protein